MAALSLLQATLTLPGIAGIVLTIGMAVDANVLIFERIREEVRVGKTPISAIEGGYRQAMRTIIDANLTTLIAAVLLYAFGSGAGARLRGHARHRHRDLDVHRDHPDPLVDHHLAAARAPGHAAGLRRRPC